jgi:hypothetical protein
MYLVPVVEKVNILVDIDLVINGADGFVFAALTLALASALALDRGVLLRLSLFWFSTVSHMIELYP